MDRMIQNSRRGFSLSLKDNSTVLRDEYAQNKKRRGACARKREKQAQRHGIMKQYGTNVKEHEAVKNF